MLWCDFFDFSFDISWFPVGFDYLQRMSIDVIKNGFKLKKYHEAEDTTDTDYTDDSALLANTQEEAESLLHSQEHATGGIVFYVNAIKLIQVFIEHPNKRVSVTQSFFKVGLDAGPLRRRLLHSPKCLRPR